MKDFFKRIKADFMLSSLICLALGVVFIIWKEAVVDILGTVLSIGLLVVGLIFLCGFFARLFESVPAILTGIVFVAFGIWLLVDPSRIFSLIPIVIGIGLVFQGIRGIVESVSAKNYGLKSWGVNFILSIVNAVLGILCIIFASSIIEAAAVFVGIMLIYNGLSNLWIIGSGSHARRSYEKNQIIDVELIEDKE